ncbi:MAG: four helix bundle protein [Chloroflexi bacterium]|nr:four helix bundle protein [Chloroflexota bacterium]
METNEKYIKNYCDLIVWQKSISLMKSVYSLMSKFPRQEDFGLTSQVRRAAISIPSNIAEGQARRHRSEFVQFLHIALGSLSEMDTQIVIAGELGYLNEKDIVETDNLILEIRTMLFSLIRNLPGR